MSDNNFRDFNKADSYTVNFFILLAIAFDIIVWIAVSFILAKYFEMPAGDAIAAGFVACLVCALVLLVAVMRFTFPAVRSIIVGRLEIATGKNFDSDPRVGNGMSERNTNLSDRKRLSATFYKSNGKREIPYITKSELRSILTGINVLRGMPERQFIGGGKLFRASERTEMETVRDILTNELGILEQRASDGAYVETGDGEGIIYYHFSQEDKQAHHYSPTAELSQNWQ